MTGLALSSPIGIAVSPDDGNVYVASLGSDALAVLDRQTSGATVGALSQSTGPDGCISKDGSSGACGTASTLSGSFGVAVSPDHETVYVTALNTNSLTPFARQATSPQISVDDAQSTEVSDVGFTIKASRMSSSAITVDLVTSNGTATAPADFATATSPGQTIAMGSTQTTRSVTVVQDTMDEDDETFSMNISNASGGTIVDPQGIGTIIDDDDPPSLSVADVTKAEGDSGTSMMKFKLLLSGPSGKEIQVTYATADGTGEKIAKAGKDYTATNGTATFAPGIVKVVVKVPIIGDTKPEPAESFFLNLSGETNASLPDAQAKGKITNDD